jgi:hypothetical protein
LSKGDENLQQQCHPEQCQSEPVEDLSKGDENLQQQCHPEQCQSEPVEDLSKGGETFSSSVTLSNVSLSLSKTCRRATKPSAPERRIVVLLPATADEDDAMALMFVEKR